MANTKTPLEENRIYHIYNHAVGNELLFVNDNNYNHFLTLVKKHLLTVFDIYAYCLMPNHFHLLIKTKEIEEIQAVTIKNPTRVWNPRRVNEAAPPYSQKLSNLFNSYAQAYNKQLNRKGSLFNNRFKRKLIDSEMYLLKLIHYMHYNPVEAGLCDSPKHWIYSSYNAIVSLDNSNIRKDETLELFGGLENFLYCHKVHPQISGVE